MKLAAITIVALCLMTPQLQEGHSAPNKKAAQGKQNATNPPNQATAVYNQPSPAQIQGSKNDDKNDDVDVERQLAKFTLYLVFVGAIQCVILAVQGVLFFQQKNIMGQHKTSLEQLADAAVLNARAVINSERPWIIVRPSESKEGGIKFGAKNIGRTPARIISCSYDISYRRSVEEMPKPPKYEQAVDNWVSWLAADDSYPILKDGFNRDTFYDQTSEGFVTNGNLAIFWGRIVYSDPILPKVHHETRFCYYCLTESDSPILSGGPDGYIENS